jgi:hypothetical protein
MFFIPQLLLVNNNYTSFELEFLLMFWFEQWLLFFLFLVKRNVFFFFVLSFRGLLNLSKF